MPARQTRDHVRTLNVSPHDGAHLVVVRGLTHQEVPTRVRQREELN